MRVETLLFYLLSIGTRKENRSLLRGRMTSLCSCRNRYSRLRIDGIQTASSRCQPAEKMSQGGKIERSNKRTGANGVTTCFSAASMSTARHSVAVIKASMKTPCAGFTPGASFVLEVVSRGYVARKCIDGLLRLKGSGG